jgi:hypothetical protein
MKIFNMKINNKFWNTFFKLLFLAFIILLCIYILYFSSIKTVEGFAQECNNCSINPTSGNCIPLYDMSYTLLFPRGNEFTISFEKIDTNYLFCPYEPNCDGSENYMENIKDKNSRIDTSKNRIRESIADITCCSGSIFYDNHLTNYKTAYETNISNYTTIKNKCDKFKEQLHDYFKGANNNTIFTKPNSFEITEDEIKNLSLDKRSVLYQVMNRAAYKNIVSFCTKSNPNHVNYNNFIDSQDFSGMLFKKNVEVSGNILEDRNLKVQEILNYQNILEISLNDLSDEAKKLRILEINNLNEELQRLDLSNSFDLNRKFEIQQKLADSFSEIEYKTYNYELYNINTNNIDGNRFMAVTGNYTLNEDKFFDCSGNIQIMNMEPSFNEEIFNPNDDINYFGADINAEYITQSELTPSDNRKTNLLEEDLKYLEQVKPGGTAPVGVINQYLSAINGFYEKQIRTMLGPQIHTVNKQPVFENDNLKIKESTFFVYENDPNNTYECQESVTGNDKFKNCGPPAYYTEFKS